MKRKLKNAFKSILRKLFELGQNLGFSVLPMHFYSQIPHISSLKKETYWQHPRSMDAILGSAVSSQVDFAASLFSSEFSNTLPAREIHKTAIRENGADGGYGPVESDFLYAFIRQRMPAKVVQVGCGVSTSVILRAAADVGYQPEIVCVEPYPTRFLRDANGDGRITLVEEQAQKVDLETFTQLSDGDLFFVDSTHTVKPGSEVNRIVLDVLPKFEAGVYVHFHDIYFPFDYTRNTLSKDLFFWSESALLQAFLTGNKQYQIKVSLSMLHYYDPEALKELIPTYIPQDNDHGLCVGQTAGKHFPSATYLQSIQVQEG